MVTAAALLVGRASTSPAQAICGGIVLLIVFVVLFGLFGGSK